MGGVDRVHTSFMSYWELQSEEQDPQERTWARQLYEHHLLNYVHYHNWFSRWGDNDVGCDVCEAPAQYHAHIFWVGFYGSMRDDLAGAANIARTDPQAWKEKNMKTS